MAGFSFGSPQLKGYPSMYMIQELNIVLAIPCHRHRLRVLGVSGLVVASVQPWKVKLSAGGLRFPW